ncbi:MAG: hypothetical protein QM619_13915 [Micropruina sp.]|uniref:hypothetical protein n=1 Tax=Micropruina sp. TaxID=2737536 RepID=UPI0039E325BE
MSARRAAIAMVADRWKNVITLTDSQVDHIEEVTGQNRGVHYSPLVLPRRLSGSDS